MKCAALQVRALSLAIAWTLCHHVSLQADEGTPEAMVAKAIAAMHENRVALGAGFSTTAQLQVDPPVSGVAPSRSEHLTRIVEDFSFIVDQFSPNASPFRLTLGGIQGRWIASLDPNNFAKGQLFWWGESVVRDAMGWLAGDESGASLSRSSDDVLSALECAISAVRPNLEVVNGFPCVVVDVYNPNAFLESTIALSVDRLGAVVKRTKYAQSGFIIRETSNEKFVRMSDAWVPCAGSRLIAFEGSPDISEHQSRHLVNSEGVAIAEGVVEGDVVLPSSIMGLVPPGTAVLERETNAKLIATANAVDATTNRSASQG